MNKSLEKYIEQFLEERRESMGGYAPVEKKDIYLLEQIIIELTNAKWERDPDGDYPIEAMIIDKTKMEFPPFEPYPHMGDVSKNNYKSMLSIINMNAQIGMDRLDTFIKITRDMF